MTCGDSARWKAGVDGLAVFGAPRAFPEPLHVGRPNIGDPRRVLERIASLLERRWLSNGGPYVRELEERICDLVEARNCVATCSGTAGLELVVRAMGLTGEVIVPAFTFIATAHVLEWHGIRPVFCDVGRHTHTLDPVQVEAKITPRTSGVIGVHLWGRPCEIDALTDVTRRHGLRLLFDAAHAVRCSYRGRMVGNFGDAEVFSFHATKVVNSFEGGAVVTNDDALAARLRLLQNFGFSGYDEVVAVGVNAKMNEASAAMGLTSLESLEEFVAVNRRHHAQYARELAGLRGVRVLPYDDGERNNYQYLVLEVDAAAAGVSRDRLQQVLWAENVLARRYFSPGCHRQEPYRSRPDGVAALPVTDALSACVLCLPTGTAVGPAEITAVSQLVRLVVEHGREIEERWSERTGTSSERPG